MDWQSRAFHICDRQPRTTECAISHTSANLACAAADILLKTVYFLNGTRFALSEPMESVIEFPRLKLAEEAPESTSPVGSKKIFNIADWAPKTPVRLDHSIDPWPFCAA